MFSLHDMTNAITNNAIAMSNNARFITTYYLSRDLGGGSHVLGGGSYVVDLMLEVADLNLKVPDLRSGLL